MKRNYNCKISLVFTILAFIFGQIMPTYTYAQSVSNLPQPGTMVLPTPGYISPFLKGITINPSDPFQFDFIVDSGHSGLEGKSLEAESSKLIRYFLASLTIPEKDAWVNLSPYEEGRIIPEEFGMTEMGRDLLAQDYLLKQLASSLMYPESESGRRFWDKVYKKAQEAYGTSEVPVNTFNKVWIVPEKAVIYEYANTAIVLESRLKVMLEEDYLAASKNSDSKTIDAVDLRKNKVDESENILSSIIREELVPIIEKEINEGENFSLLRQIYQSMILATWYKTKIKQSPLNQLYADKKKVDGIAIENKNIKQDIYDRYIEAFKKGVFDYIKEDYNQATQEIISRKYFSGGVDLPIAEELDAVGPTTHTLTNSDSASVGKYKVYRVGLQSPGENDSVANILTMARSRGGFFGFFKRDKGKGGQGENVEFLEYVERLKRGRVTFSLNIAGKEVGRQMGFGSEFTAVYDRLVQEVQKELSQSDGIDISRVIQIAESLLGGTSGFSPESALAQREGREEAGDNGFSQLGQYLDLFEQGDVAFSLRLSGKETARQLGFGSGFSQLYDELIRRVQKELQVSGVVNADRLKEIGRRLLDEISEDALSEKISSTEASSDFAEAISIVKEDAEGAISAMQVDEVLKKYEQFVRRKIQSSTQRREVARQAAMSIAEINKVLIPKKFLVEQSPLGLSDDRVFVLYGIEDSIEEDTKQGRVVTYFINQITKFKDGLLRGNPGWSNMFNRYVIVFRQAVQEFDEKEILAVLDGGMPFHAIDSRSARGQENERLASVAGALIRAGLGDREAAERLELQEEAVRVHEMEHEVRRRMVDFKEGDMVHGDIEEGMAEVKSIIDSREPLHILAHIVELAAGDMEFAWSILQRLSLGKSHSEIITWLEEFTSNGLDVSILKARAQQVFSEMEREWEDAYDFAMVSNPGGIDFNAQFLELQTNGKPVLINFSNLGSTENLDLKGLTPVIFNVTSLPSLNPLLGFSNK